MTVLDFNKHKSKSDSKELYDKDVEIADKIANCISKHLTDTSNILIDEKRMDNILSHVDYFIRMKVDL